MKLLAKKIATRHRLLTKNFIFKSYAYLFQGTPNCVSLIICVWLLFCLIWLYKVHTVSCIFFPILSQNYFFVFLCFEAVMCFLHTLYSICMTIVYIYCENNSNIFSTYYIYLGNNIMNKYLFDSPRVKPDLICRRKRGFPYIDI